MPLRITSLHLRIWAPQCADSNGDMCLLPQRPARRPRRGADVTENEYIDADAMAATYLWEIRLAKAVAIAVD